MKNSNDKINFNALRFAWDLGFTVAVPLVLLLLLGLYLDRKFSTAPLFVLASVIFSVVISSFSIYRIVMKVFKQMDGTKEDKKKQQQEKNFSKKNTKS